MKLTTTKVAKLLNVCQQRISTKITQGHFPSAHRCECGRSILISSDDLSLAVNRSKGKKGKANEKTLLVRLA